jgi:hypothetical protein
VNATRALGQPPPREGITLEQNGSGNPAALAAVEASHPGWQCWEGTIAGVLYARRLMSSPPRVVRATTAAALAEAIEADERQWGRR